jgi:hypothetical protein
MYELRRDVRRLLKKRLPGSLFNLEATSDCEEVLDHFADRICDSFDPCVEKLLNSRLEKKTFEERRVLIREYSMSLSTFLAVVGDKYYASRSLATSVTPNTRIKLSHEIYNLSALLQALDQSWTTLDGHALFRRRQANELGHVATWFWPFRRLSQL